VFAIITIINHSREKKVEDEDEIITRDERDDTHYTYGRYANGTAKTAKRHRQTVMMYLKSTLVANSSF